jgi:chaperonin GroEL
VIDPAKVTKNALLNASSIAGLLHTTGAMVCEIPEGRPETAAGGSEPGMRGMY